MQIHDLKSQLDINFNILSDLNNTSIKAKILTYTTQYHLRYNKKTIINLYLAIWSGTSPWSDKWNTGQYVLVQLVFEAVKIHKWNK